MIARFASGGIRVSFGGSGGVGGRGRIALLFESNVALTGGNAKGRAAVAYRAGKVLVGVRSLRGQGEIIVQLAVGGLGVDREAGVFGNSESDGAIAVLDGDIAQRRRARHIDEAVAIGNGDIPGNAIERNVAAAGADGKRPHGLAGGEIGVITDIGFSIEPAQLHVGAGGVEPDGVADVLKVGGAEEVPIDSDRAAQIGEGEVLPPAFDGYRAGDAVGRKGGVRRY